MNPSKDFKKRLRTRRTAPLRYRDEDQISPFAPAKRPRQENSTSAAATATATPSSEPPIQLHVEPPALANIRRSARFVSPVNNDEKPQQRKKNGSKSSSKKSRKKAEKEQPKQRDEFADDENMVVILPEDQIELMEDKDEEFNKQHEQNNGDHVIVILPEDQEANSSEDDDEINPENKDETVPEVRVEIQRKRTIHGKEKEKETEELSPESTKEGQRRQDNGSENLNNGGVPIEENNENGSEEKHSGGTLDKEDKTPGTDAEGHTNNKETPKQTLPKAAEKANCNQDAPSNQKGPNSHILGKKNLESTADNMKIVHTNLGNAQKQLASISTHLKENSKYLSSLVRATAQDGRFTLDFQMTELANRLLDSKPIKLDNGIEVIDIPHNMLSEESRSLKLITRKHMRSLCEDVVQWLDDSDGESRAIITGSLGIGKSWALIYLLRLLLKRGHDVMFANRKSELYVMFERPNSNGVCLAKSCKNHTTDPITKADDNVYVLVDPCDSGNDVQTTGRRLILSASPNRKHYPGWEEGNAARFFLPMCSEAECLTWKKALGSEDISDEVIRERFPVVGGAPRYIFNSRKFANRKQALEMEYLRERDVDMLLSGRGPSSKASAADQHLASMFLTYDVEQSKQDKVDYMQESIRFISHYAMLRVVEYVMKSAFTTVVDNGDSSCLGARFEDLVCVHLLHGGTFNIRQILNTTTTSRTSALFLRKAVPHYIVNESVMLGKMCQPADSLSGSSLGFNHKNRVLFVPSRSFPVINFVDSESLWFSATTELNPTITDNEWSSIIKHVEKKGIKADLYWCVPERQAYQRFQPPTLPETLSNYIRQHILWIPSELVVG